MAALSEILMFITGHEEVPPMGLDGGISVDYLPEGPVLPNTAVCFNLIRLPILGSKEEFFSKMDLGIQCSNGYYGRS